MREQIAGAQTMAIVAMMLAGAGVAAGAAAGADGRDLGNAAAAGMSLPQEMARRSILSYQRGEEQAADRAAVSYLNKTGQSAKGMLETFARLQNDQLFMSQRIDPYMLSHPMARERIGTLEQLARKSPYFHKKDPPALQARHDLMRAKLVGFTERPETVNRKYPASDTSLPADYARAISAYIYGDLNKAVTQIDALIARQPENPYFHELKGQALLEGGRAAQAVAPLRRAVELSNGHPLNSRHAGAGACPVRARRGGRTGRRPDKCGRQHRQGRGQYAGCHPRTGDRHPARPGFPFRLALPRHSLWQAGRPAERRPCIRQCGLGKR